MTVRVKFSEAGFRALLTGAGSQGLVEEHAERVAAAANAVPSTTSPAHDQPYYKIEDGSDAKRARRRVVSDGARAAVHEAKTQALLRAL